VPRLRALAVVSVVLGAAAIAPSARAAPAGTSTQAAPGAPGEPLSLPPAAGVVMVPVAPLEPSRGFRLGWTNSLLFGFAGGITNPEMAYGTAIDFGFPTGRAVRYHVDIGFENLNAFKGLKFSPLTLGYAIPVWNREFALEVEVLVTIIEAEVLWKDLYSIALGSGLRGQVVLTYGRGFVGFSPIGIAVRYAYGDQDIGIRTGVGANWPLQLTLGVEL
jgi:hypothetical protein